MPWNWQLPDWPRFIYDTSSMAPLEKKFLHEAGGGIAVLKHLEDAQKKQFIVEILCAEGLNSAEIEGEILQRESLQSSIQRHFGLPSETKVFPREQSMGDLLWTMYDTFDQALTHQMLFEWHRLLMGRDNKISDVGKYRTHEDPMQIISGRYDKRVVYFEAPPSKQVRKEMTKFIQWFNASIHDESPLVRAALSHVYFESIHPFEDGNGRIGRALVEKALSQSLGYPTLMAISQIISKKKKQYYSELAACNRTLKVDHWVHFFSEVILEAQLEAFSLINFLMAKSTLMNRLKGRLNSRQEKVLLRMFAEGPSGFQGGLSAENYLSITKCSRPTATRDLADLVEKEALFKTGKLRHTRYWLNF